MFIYNILIFFRSALDEKYTNILRPLGQTEAEQTLKEVKLCNLK